ncbi:hypothetical protein [Streptomyces sp. CB03234]|uniref:hypothetical protein n=1 Tax=Streptomyces sp. (strain CB03234) TaxID=1703937 RepID=UPI003083A86E
MAVPAPAVAAGGVPGAASGTGPADGPRPARSTAPASAADARPAPGPSGVEGTAGLRPVPVAGPAGEAAAETTARLRPVRESVAAPSPSAPSSSAPSSVPPAPVTPPTRRRPVGAVDLTARPGAPVPRAAQPYWMPPETPVETTTRLRPVRSRHPARAAAAVACLVLGLGLTGGAAAGAWLVGDSAAHASAADRFTEARTIWHSVPVDTLFPRTLDGEGAGPGRADRTWTRVAVAPDGPCTGALDPLLVRALQPVGCERVLRATYTDATSTSVTTVGMVFTDADRPGMAALRTRFTDQSLDERTDLLPRTLAAPGTVAAGFGDPQRASWRVSVLTDVPVIVYAVSGFADGRTVDDPQPAAEAMAEGQTSTPAQAGLGHDADGIADRIERGLRTTARKATQEPQ